MQKVIGVSMKFFCWNEGYNGEGDPHELEADTAYEAAEKYAEHLFYEWEPFESMEIGVKDTNGLKTLFEVDVESSPSFYAEMVNK